MSTGAGTFEHYRKNGGSPVIRPITTTPVAERIRSRRKPDPTGPLRLPLLGAWVRGRSAWTGEGVIVGQVWSACGLISGDYWWVVTSEGTSHPVHEDNMTLLAKRDEDAPLFGEEMAS